MEHFIYQVVLIGVKICLDSLQYTRLGAFYSSVNIVESGEVKIESTMEDEWRSWRMALAVNNKIKCLQKVKLTGECKVDS